MVYLSIPNIVDLSAKDTELLGATTYC